MARPKGDASVTEARRQDILKSAFEVFAKHGYDGSSLRQISELVGITEAGILHHFKTKATLLTSVLTYRDELTNAQFAITDSSGLDFVKNWLDLIRYNISVPGVVELYTVMSAGATSEKHPAHEYFKNRYETVIDTVNFSMLKLQAEGNLRYGLDPIDLSRALIALSDGLQVQWLLDRKWDMLEEHKSFFRRILTESAAVNCGLI
jgi:AcrR family transcriptional regulator